MLRIGLLGASRIAPGAIVGPAEERADVVVTRVAARQPGRAAEFAEQHGIPGIAADYESLLHSPDVDLVYISLPPAQHARWSVAAVSAGKHVLCEKPFAMTAMEARAMAEAAQDAGRVLVEAFHYRFHPLFLNVLEILSAGTIGRIRHIECRFNVPVAFSSGEIRYHAGLGGGAMMDLGCYPVHWARAIAGAEPSVERASAQWHPCGVDVSMQATLAFPNRVGAAVSASMSEALPDRLDAVLCVTGERGQLSVDNPLVPHIGSTLTVENDDGVVTKAVSGRSTYHYQLEHVVALLRGDATPVTGGQDAIGNMQVLDDIYSRAGARPGSP